MAAKKPKEDTAALAADEGAVVPRIAHSEKGYTGLKTSSGRVYEECIQSLRFPAFYRTIDEMRKTAIIASALGAYKFLLSRVQWQVVAPVDASEKEKQRAKIVDSMKDDMEHSWGDFIGDVFEYIPYGHSVQEKVYRRRLKKNGSRFNDGLVGIRRLSPRAQETLYKWEFSEDGRELLAVLQSLDRMENGHLFINNADPEGLIRIPREKFLLFTADSTRGNPLGNSLLKNVYLSWKQLTALKDQELLGISKETAGVPIARLPVKYMSPEAADEDKAVLDATKTVLDNLANGTSNYIIFPTLIDELSKKDMFDISLLEKKGVNGANIDTVIKRYQDEILSALFVDILKAGNNTGSFSLNDGDTNVLALAMSHRLNEIADVLNTQLIPQIYAMNGWTTEVLPKFVPSDISAVSLEELSKFLQRTASTGLIERDREIMNIVRKAVGAKPRPDDEPVDEEALTTNSSNSGKGMEVGRNGTGTAKIGGDSNNQDQSTNNSENAA